MDSVEELLEILNKQEYIDTIREMYLSIKVSLKDEWQDVDDETMISYIRAYCVHLFRNAPNKRAKDLFSLSLELGYALIGILDTFADNMNTIYAKVAEPIHKEGIEELKRLTAFQASPIYKEISKSNKEIAILVKRQYGFVTIDEIKKGKYQKKYGYEISKEEIEAIEKTKTISTLNQIAHTIYDRRNLFSYPTQDEEDDDDILKKCIITTGKTNPEYNILFRDGTIVNYHRGDIRIKPYNFKQIIHFTKLFYASRYAAMKDFYIEKLGMKDDGSVNSQVGIQMLLSASLNTLILLRSTEEVYSKRMIDDSKETFEKIKKIAKEYDL